MNKQKVVDHFKANWAKYALGVGVLAGAYYGVPPEVTKEFLTTVCTTVGAC